MQGFFRSPDRAFGQVRRVARTLGQRSRRATVLGTVLLIASTATVWATSNTLPLFTTVTINQSVINEGQSVTVTGAFTDPDASDFHSIRIRWGDEPVGIFSQQINLPPGQLNFQVSHVYRDNLPANSRIRVTVYDRQTPPGGDPNDNTDNFPKDNRHLPITVKNVPPRFVDSSIVGTASAGGVVVEGDFTDPGAADSFTMTARIGDPIYPPNQTPMTCTLAKGTKHFRCEYVQQPPSAAAKIYSIGLAIRDDDGGQDTHTMKVHFPGAIHP